MPTHSNKAVDSGVGAPRVRNLAASLGLHRVAPGAQRPYVVFTETTGDYKTFYHFIRRRGNGGALRHLKNELGRIETWLLTDKDGVSHGVFELDLSHPVSVTTVAEMMELGDNGFIPCTRLDGEMRMIDFGFTRGDSLDDDAMSRRVSSAIGRGRIKEFFD